MIKPIEQALENLIPRHSESLPSELTELANFLLVQSRNKCNLKAEEEVARVYACAHMACERLKSSLNLPQIEARPPVPPRAYNKLYAYLNKCLAPGTPSRSRVKSVPNTPRRKLQFSPTKQPSSHKTSFNDMPFKDLNLSQKRKHGLTYLSNRDKENRVPGWVGAVIRFLCKETQTTAAMPHVFAGVESIICLRISPKGRSLVPDEPPKELKLPAMIAAIWLLVVSRLYRDEEQLQEETEKKIEARACILRSKNSIQLQKMVRDSSGKWLGWESFEDDDVDLWKKEITSRSWKEMDWWMNLEEYIATKGENREMETFADLAEDEETEYSDGSSPNQIETRSSKRARLNLDKYDYLSTERRQEYAAWKNKILLHISTMISA